jgi:hypothetical protein
MEKINKSVLNQICGEEGNLKKEEFDFICNFQDITYKEISEILKCSVSAITRWRQVAEVPYLESLFLKEYAWLKAFSEEFSEENFMGVLGPKKLENLNLLERFCYGYFGTKV